MMLETIDKDSLRERIEKVLSEILSDKHDCKVTLRFVPKNEKGVKTDERTSGNDSSPLCVDGA